MTRPADSQDPLQIVAGRIRDRYATPSRKAYTYLFWVHVSGTHEALIPAADAVIRAWVDEGAGLLPSDREEAVRRCAATREQRPQDGPSGQLSGHARRQMMARAIVFTLEQTGAGQIDVHLWSRALGFTPKGDREAHEQWECTVDGEWYSAYRGD